MKTLLIIVAIFGLLLLIWKRPWQKSGYAQQTFGRGRQQPPQPQPSPTPAGGGAVAVAVPARKGARQELDEWFHGDKGKSFFRTSVIIAAGYYLGFLIFAYWILDWGSFLNHNWWMTWIWIPLFVLIVNLISKMNKEGSAVPKFFALFFIALSALVLVPQLYGMAYEEAFGPESRRYPPIMTYDDTAPATTTASTAPAMVVAETKPAVEPKTVDTYFYALPKRYGEVIYVPDGFSIKFDPEECIMVREGNGMERKHCPGDTHKYSEKTRRYYFKSLSDKPVKVAITFHGYSMN